MSTPADDATCPDCGAELDGARSCPECGLPIRTEDGELASEATTAIVGNALTAAADTSTANRTLPYPLRLATALAIAVPFGPLAAFLLVSIVPASSLAVVIVGVSAWMLPAGLLARATVPSLIVGRGLTVLGSVVAAAPLLAAFGRTLAGDAAVTNPAIGSSKTVLGSFLLFGIAILGLGFVVTRVALRKRRAWREADDAVQSDGQP